MAFGFRGIYAPLFRIDCRLYFLLSRKTTEEKVQGFLTYIRKNLAPERLKTLSIRLSFVRQT